MVVANAVQCLGPGYEKYIAFFDVASTRGHAPCSPSDVRNGQFRYGGDPTRHSIEICAQLEAGLIGKNSRHFERTSEDGDSLTPYGHDGREIPYKMKHWREFTLAVC